ncbi:hypothetical protein [Algoriphagus mannitolivorans]|uniref:hypothetical protein n=1 Tax=Algoriphagus mannitolivorans TaxID=226504 RepID=UPI000414578E|nr:hypothetical protein [Algoriphagus mannitolivorans]
MIFSFFFRRSLVFKANGRILLDFISTAGHDGKPKHQWNEEKQTSFHIPNIKGDFI